MSTRFAVKLMMMMMMPTRLGLLGVRGAKRTASAWPRDETIGYPSR